MCRRSTLKGGGVGGQRRGFVENQKSRAKDINRNRIIKSSLGTGRVWAPAAAALSPDWGRALRSRCAEHRRAGERQVFQHCVSATGQQKGGCICLFCASTNQSALRCEAISTMALMPCSPRQLHNTPGAYTRHDCVYTTVDVSNSTCSQLPCTHPAYPTPPLLTHPCRGAVVQGPGQSFAAVVV